MSPTEQEQAIRLLSDVRDVPAYSGIPDPIQSQVCVQRLRTLLGVRGGKTAESAAQAVTPPKRPRPGPLTCGKGPYRAAIVPSKGGEAIWVSLKKYASEKQAQQEILRKAKILKHCVAGYCRHWITDEKEHIIDYGSHAFYGRITPVKDK